MSHVDPTLSLAHSLVSSPGVHAVFLGSGVSRSSGIPTGWEVTIRLARDLATMLGEDSGNDAAAWYRQKFDKEPSYSALLALLARAGAERRNLLEKFFEPNEEEREQGLKRPTAAHHAVAQMMARGYVKVVLTTNFDRLMEAALYEAGITPLVVSSDDNVDSMTPLVHQRHVVIKLHGDYKDPRIKNTDSELSAYSDAFSRLIHQVLSEFGIVICGWSSDWDSALRAEFKRIPTFRYSATWSSLGEPSASAQKLIQHRGAALALGQDADRFFSSVLEKVISLEHLQEQQPRSIDIAVATVKRYVAEDRYRVQLADFIHAQTTPVVASVQDLLSPQNITNTQPLPTVRAIDEMTEVLRHVFFSGCRYARGNDQESVFLRALQMMPPSNEIYNVPMHDWQRAIRFYATSVCFYAAAVGALVAENWGFLHTLTALEFDADGEKTRIAFKELSAAIALQDLAAREATPNRKFPAQAHYEVLLRPLLEGVVQSPTDAFHRLEVWLALRACEYGPINGYLYVPPGDYLLTKYMAGKTEPDALFQEAEKASKGWAPLRSGWFGGEVATFETCRAALNASMSHLASYIYG